MDEQIGRDDSLRGCVKSIVCTFEQVKRVLRDDGTVDARARAFQSLVGGGMDIAEAANGLLAMEDD